MSKRTEALLGKLMDRDLKRGAKIAPLPPKKFGLIYADPPWHVKTYSEEGRGRLPDAKMPGESEDDYQVRLYKTLTLDEMKAMPVAEAADADCMLLMWIIGTHMPQALELGTAWGFTYKTVGFYWPKLRKIGKDGKVGRPAATPEKEFPSGMGYWTRANPEQCLLFTRGKPKRIDKGVPKLIPFDDYPITICANRREHSRKPDEVYTRIDRLLGDVPKLELFARTTAPGWVVWGNETGKFDAKPKRSKAELLA